MKMTFQEIRIIATDPCIANQLRDVNTICRRSWYIAAHVWCYNSINILWYQKHKSAKILLSKNTCHKKFLPPTGFLIAFFPTKKIIYYESSNQLRDVNTICRRSWYIAAHIWKIYDLKIEVVLFIINFSTDLTTVVKFEV
jgi:hypothetical protein